MRFLSSVASSLVLVFLLSVAAPLAAAPRNSGDEPRWRGPIDRIVRVVKVVKRFFGVSSNSDVMIPPTP